MEQLSEFDFTMNNISAWIKVYDGLGVCANVSGSIRFV